MIQVIVTTATFCAHGSTPDELELKAPAVHQMDYETELFIDDMCIQEMHGVKRVLHPATKLTQPVLNSDKPWEQVRENQCSRVYLYGTVMFDEEIGKYRMWYMGRMGPQHGHTIPGLYIPRSTDGRSAVFMGNRQDRFGRDFVENDVGDLTCYAESEDGITWHKPSLNIFEFDGDGQNNIVWDFHGACIFKDKNAPHSEQRYRAIGFCRRYRNIFLLTSSNGIEWDDSQWLQPLLHRSNEGMFNITWDSRQRLYRGYALCQQKDERRSIYYSESHKQSGPWKELRPMLLPQKQDDAVGKRKYGAIQGEYYNMSGFRYGNIYIGILSVLYVTSPGAPGMPVDGPMDAVLTYSRDGANWHHFDTERTPVIPRGEAGSFDGGMVMGVANEPLIEADSIHWYYTGSRETHGRSLKDKVMSIGRASWRLDGFVSLDADAGGGVIETVPLRLPDGRLQVNIDATKGSLTVEVLFPDGSTQPGFSADACTPIKGDHLRHTVNWNQIDLAQAQQPLRLRFSLRWAKLYSFLIIPYEAGAK